MATSSVRRNSLRLLALSTATALALAAVAPFEPAFAGAAGGFARTTVTGGKLCYVSGSRGYTRPSVSKPSFSKNVTINKNTWVNKPTTVNKNVTINKPTFVHKNTTINKPVTINKSVDNSKNITVNKPVWIEKNTTINKSIDNSKNITVNKPVWIEKNTTINKSVDNSKNINIEKNINNSKNIDNSKNIHVEKNIDASRNIHIEKNVNIDKSITIVKNSFNKGGKKNGNGDGDQDQGQNQNQSQEQSQSQTVNVFTDGGGDGNGNGDSNARSIARAVLQTYVDSVADAMTGAEAQVFGGGSSFTTVVNKTDIIGGAAASAEAYVEEECVEQWGTVVKAIRAVCVDRSGRAHPAARMRPETFLDSSYGGEIYRCLEGAHLKVALGDVVESTEGMAGIYDGAQTFECRAGEALRHFKGGLVKCAAQIKVKECTERSNLRQYGVGDIFFSFEAKICAWSKREAGHRGKGEYARRSELNLSGMSLTGGVGYGLY